MGNPFKKPKKPDDSDAKKLQAKQEARIKSQEAELTAKKASKRQGNQGRASLISGSERGNQSSGSTGTPTRTTTG